MDVKNENDYINALINASDQIADNNDDRTREKENKAIKDGYQYGLTHHSGSEGWVGDKDQTLLEIIESIPLPVPEKAVYSIIAKAVQAHPITSYKDTITALEDRMGCKLSGSHKSWLKKLLREQDEATRKYHTVTTDSLPEFDINSYDAASLMLSGWYSAIFVDMRPMGSGKTLFTALLWAYLQMNNKAFGYVAPRVSIITDIANRLDIEHYNEVSPGELFQSLAACVNSAVGREHLLSFFRQVDCIVLDEFKQIVEHIVRGPFKNRSEGYDLLIDIIKTVPVVYVADADMNDQMIKILESAGKPMFKIKGSEREPAATIKHTTTNIARSEFLTFVKAGKTGLFQCDSLSTANIAYEDAKATAPAEYKILLVHGKNKDEFEQAAYLRSPNEVGKQYDLIILTPVVSSGFSIELEYDFHVGVFSGQLSPTEIIQTLGRNRKAKDIILGLSQKRKQKPLSVTEQLTGIVLAERRMNYRWPANTRAK
ncbi:DEAD/DEAH box helicase family protein [Bathymodiolus japonicus methanotrophic gill symbiont]|uniref:DEAD/DEAH box helicase family protein n=1 Tax=Bathymodiolus japonicus methanotrophic gill symbiont TaxID=113269 RepID=UPI001C8DA8DB|nr:DEAD/DEAH box helicase family protein [Bathymodiolus japonicus methanotrophic gill symbiont]